MMETLAGPPGVAVFSHGFILGLGLIVAIGAQNAFVLRQGLRREHVGPVVAWCAAAASLAWLTCVVARTSTPSTALPLSPSRKISQRVSQALSAYTEPIRIQ